MAQLTQNTFTQANGSLTGWTIVPLGGSGIVVLDNQFVADGPADVCLAVPTGVVFPANHYAQITISESSAPTSGACMVGVAVRVQDALNAYFWRQGTLSGGPVRQLYKIVAGSYTQIYSDSVATTVGMVVKLSAVGTTITLTIDGVVIYTGTDSDLATGSAGIEANHDSTATFVRGDNFEAGNALAPTVSSITADEGEQGETLEVTVVGTNFDSDGAAVLSFSGTGITVDSYVSRSATQIVANITISGAATVGLRNVIVNNPSDSQAGSLSSAFEVTSSGPVVDGLTTRCMRASALTTLRPWLIAPPLPDSTLNQGDRQHIAYMYCGILAGSAVIIERIVVDLASLHAYPRVGVEALECFPDVGVDALESFADVGIDSLEAYPR